MDEDNKIQDFSQDEQVVTKSDVNLELPKTKQPIYIRTLNVFANPLRGRYEKYYKTSKKHLVFDLILIFLIILLIIINIILSTLRFPVKDVEIKIHRGEVGGEQVVKGELILSAPRVVYATEEGEPLGVGNWPPKVGEKTRVRIFVELIAKNQNIKEVQLKAQLPAGINWTGMSVATFGHALAYDSKDSSVIWSLGELWTGQKAEANFEVELMPNTGDQGKKIKLLEKLMASGIDNATGQGLTVTGNDAYSPAVEF